MAVAIALLSLPFLSSTAYAGEPGVCDTNKDTGKIDSFMQNSEPDGSGEWMNGNMNATKADFKEGDWVPQRVQMSGLQPGENELAFTYTVWLKNKGDIKWAYDDVRFKGMDGATVTRWYVQDPDGPTATVYVTFDVPAGSTAASLYYDLHIASELDHGAGSGAGSIDGSPYHGGLLSLNCAKSGQNANQIMASAIQAGLLTVVKDATPADGTDFHFSITPGGDASTFALDDDSDPTLPDRLTYRVPPGTFTVEEIDLPGGWNLTDVVCSKAPSASTPTSRTVSLVDDEQVTCTFKNSKVARKDLSVTSTADPSYLRDYDWSVDKSVVGAATRKIAEGQSASFDYSVVVTPSGPNDSEFRVKGRISVTNPNDIAVDGVSISDTIPGATCTVSDNGTAVTGPVTIPAGGKDFTYGCDMGGDTRSDTVGTNTVNLTWSATDYYGTTGAATGAQGFDFSTASPTVSDDSVTVTDSSYDLASLPGGNVVRAQDGPRTFAYPLTWAGEPGLCTHYDNTATITETDGGKQSDKAVVEVCEGKDLTVAKTVVSDYYRTYAWSLDKKVVGPARKDVDANGVATFDYAVTATAGSTSDSTWGMSGTITVSNPNAWAVTLTDIRDQVNIGGGASCAVAKGTDLTVAANADRRFAYTCTFTSQPSYDGTNTATVTWDGTQHVSPHTSATGTAAVVAANWKETSVDKTVTVVDDETDPAHPVVLGTATWAGEGSTKTFTYTGPALAGKKGECVDYTNNAWLQELPKVTASAKATVCWPVDLSVTKSVDATYDTTYFWDITKDVDKTSAEVDPGGTAPFTYTVVAKPNGSRDSGWTMSGTITVSNPNTFKSVTATLSDVYDGGGVCTPASGSVVVPAATKSGGAITPGVAEVAYSCAFADQPSYTGTNTVTASWDGHAVKGTADVSFRRAGRTDYQVDVLDDLTKPDGTPKVLGTATWDDPVAKRTFTNTLQLGAEPGRCVDHTNTAWLDVTNPDVAVLPGITVEGLDPFAQQTVRVCEKAPLVLSKDVTATYDTQYFWDISKEVDRTSAEVGAGDTAPFDYTVVAKRDGSRDSDWRMSGTITLTNPNDYEPATVTLSDVYDGGGVCTPESQTVEVPEGGTVEVPYTCRFTEQPAYKGTNTVTATWDGKTVTATAPVAFSQVGKEDYQVTVYDDLARPGTRPATLGTVTWDDPVEERTFTNTLELGAAPGECVDHTNTAWVAVTGTDPSAQQTVDVCSEAGLLISKTVDASFDRTYHWLIDKAVDQSRVELTGSGEATFHYTVKATPNGFTDSGYRMSGTITVTNPNGYQQGAVTATVTDVPAVGEGASCVVADGGQVVLEPGASKELGYTCSFSSPPQHTGTNRATATWTGPDAQSHSVSTDDVPVSFTPTGNANRTVTVTDSLTTPSVLGEATWNADGTPTVFHYALARDARASTCAEYRNTATIEETGQSDSETATVCREGGLVVSNTAEASYDRTYLWDISKKADRLVVDTERGETGTVRYTVGVTPTGFADSGWEMKGAVTVLNPNDYKDVTVTLSDVPGTEEGATCELAETGDLVVRAGESRTVGYTCSFQQQPAYDGSNTAVVDWGTGKVSVTTAVPFGVDQQVDKTVTVTDDHVDPAQLGTATWDESGETTTFEYALDLGGRLDECRTVTNTATIEETGQQAQADVVVCGPPAELPNKPVKHRPPAEILPEHVTSPRSLPARHLPETGAPSHAGLWSVVGGLMLTIGAALLVRRRRQEF